MRGRASPLPTVSWAEVADGCGSDSGGAGSPVSAGVGELLGCSGGVCVVVVSPKGSVYWSSPALCASAPAGLSSDNMAAGTVSRDFREDTKAHS